MDDNLVNKPGDLVKDLVNDTISRKAAIDAFAPYAEYESNRTNAEWVRRINMGLTALPSVDAVPVVRCKECKHRPTGTNRDDLEFPDDKCPCQCEDYWYSWKPADDWFCGNGERKDDERHEAI